MSQSPRVEIPTSTGVSRSQRGREEGRKSRISLGYTELYRESNPPVRGRFGFAENSRAENLSGGEPSVRLSAGMIPRSPPVIVAPSPSLFVLGIAVDEAFVCVQLNSDQHSNAPQGDPSMRII